MDDEQDELHLPDYRPVPRVGEGTSHQRHQSLSWNDRQGNKAEYFARRFAFETQHFSSWEAVPKKGRKAFSRKRRVGVVKRRCRSRKCAVEPPCSCPVLDCDLFE